MTHLFFSMIQCIFALGSNIGNREQYLQSAQDLLKKDGIVIIKKSSVYETEPFGEPNQLWYLNQVIEIETDKSPLDLLKTLKSVEKELGRKQRKKWDSREIDIDILFYENEIVDEANLKIPHPYLQDRKCVLVPLNEIAPDFFHPKLLKSVSQLLKECTDSLKVREYMAL